MEKIECQLSNISKEKRQQQNQHQRNKKLNLMLFIRRFIFSICGVQERHIEQATAMLLCMCMYPSSSAFVCSLNVSIAMLYTKSKTRFPIDEQKNRARALVCLRICRLDRHVFFLCIRQKTSKGGG